MPINIPVVLDGILTATADKANAEARIAAYRGILDTEARQRLATEGAAPSWNTPTMGKVRLDPPGNWTASVADDKAYGEHVAQHHPTEATVALYFNATDVDAALTALGFAGVTPTDSRIEVRPAYTTALLASATIDVIEAETDPETGEPDGERTFIVADGTGTVVPGLSAARTPAKLVVSLDRERRTRALDEATLGTNALLAAAGLDDAPALDPDAVHAARVELEALAVDQLATIAKARELPSSGTKATLAERIARAEVMTNQVIRPAVDQAVAAHPDAVTAVDMATAALAPGVADASDKAAAAILGTGASRDVLRLKARALGLPAGGTKAEVAATLAAAGVTAADLAEAQA
ncbi:MAG: SAP domain-containing protein [Burkholderiaceae bacterium]